MQPKNREALEKRVIHAAEAALFRKKYVSAIDVFIGMEALTPEHVAAWRKGRPDSLERVIHLNLKKMSLCMKTFRKWAAARKLEPSVTAYVGKTRWGKRDLQFSKSGHPVIELAYRTHFISSELSERKREALDPAAQCPAAPSPRAPALKAGAPAPFRHAEDFVRLPKLAVDPTSHETR